MMRSILIISLLIGGFSVSGDIVNAQDSSFLVAKASSKKRRSSKRRSKRKKKDSELVTALNLAQKGQYQKASKLLFQLSLNPRYAKKRMKIKYILGLMLYQMKLNQVSAFQFINIVKKGDKTYLRRSLEKLSLAADYLGDDTLLNYAISKVKVSSFPKEHRNMLYYRIGEYQFNGEQYKAAIQSLKKVRRGNEYFPKAKYLLGLAYAEKNNTKNAIYHFDDLITHRADQGVADTARVAALIGKARALYQKGKWESSIEVYRDVPRDTSMWHDSIFESSWAMLRMGEFRSALSNFHTIHSSYYESSYQPESLILRSIVYLFICKYDEMEKVLKLFDKVYKPVHKDVSRVLKRRGSPAKLYDQVAYVGKIQSGKVEENTYNYDIPFTVSKRIFNEGDFRRNYNYVNKIKKELKRVDSMPSWWSNSAVGKYSKRVLKNRIAKAKRKAGRIIKKHLEYVKAELFDLFEQQDFVRFEMLRGQKSTLQKKIANKSVEDGEQVDSGNERDYYVQNGYEYWPFTGEYWLDELGNYHYVGTQSCQ